MDVMYMKHLESSKTALVRHYPISSQSAWNVEGREAMLN